MFRFFTVAYSNIRGGKAGLMRFETDQLGALSLFGKHQPFDSHVCFCNILLTFLFTDVNTLVWFYGL